MFLHWTGNNLDLSQGYTFVYSSAGGTGSVDLFQGQISTLPGGVLVLESTDSGPRPIVLNNLGYPFRHAAAANGYVFYDGAGSSATVGSSQIQNNQATALTISGTQPSDSVRNIHMDPSAEFVALALSPSFSGEMPFYVYRRNSTTWTKQTLDVPSNPDTGNNLLNFADYQSPNWCSIRKYSSSQVYAVWGGLFGGVGLAQKFNGTAWTNFTALAIDADISAVDWNPVGNVIVYGRDLSGTPLSNDYFRVRTLNPSTDVVTTGPSITNPTTTPGLEITAVRWSPNGEYLAVGYSESPGCAIYKFNGSFTKLSNPFDVNPGFSVSVTDISWTSDSLYVQINGSLYARNTDDFIYQGSVTWNTKFLT